MTRRVLLIALLSMTTLVATAWAQKAVVPRQPKKEVLAEEHVEDLLLLMDTDKNGRISKQEWMKFMETEFDRLDKDKRGEIDQKEIMRSRVLVKHVDVGK